MTRKVAVAGDMAVVAGLREHAVVVDWLSPDAGGADVVVVTRPDRIPELAELIAVRAPAAVVVASDPAWCAELLERTRFPRGRVIAADDVPATVDAVLGASGAELEVTVRHDGEHGREGFHRVRAPIGAGGVLSI